MVYRDYSIRLEDQREIVGELRDGMRLYEVAIVQETNIRIIQWTDFSAHFMQLAAHRAEELVGLEKATIGRVQ